MIASSARRHARLACVLWLTSLTALSLAPVPSMAQTQVQSQAQTEAASSTSLAEVIVTSQRREERVEDVPAAITVFSGTQLEQLNFANAADLAKLTPGLTFEKSTFTPQPTIRGVGSRGVSNGEESSVPIYIDGVYNPYMVATNFQLNSIARIEVLKGPQGALYGRNSTGGAINVVTRDPAAGFHESTSLSYGSYNETLAKVYVGGGTDTLSADLAVLGYHIDGYNHNVYTHSWIGGDDNYNVRGKILFRPLDDLTLTLIGSHSQDVNHSVEMEYPLNNNTAGIRFIPQPPLPASPWDVSQLGTASYKLYQDSLALKAQAHFGRVDMNFITSATGETQKLANNNSAEVAAPLYSGNLDVPQHSTYTEIYAQSAGSSRFHWIAGVTYFRDNSVYEYLSVYQAPVAAPNNLAAGNILTNNNRVIQDSVAGYLQLAYALTDKLTATVGGRYTDERAHFEVRNFLSGTAAARLTATPQNGSGATTWKPVTPSANIEYQATPDLNLYAKAGKGFKIGLYPASSGLVNGAVTPAAAPEHITQYEIGAKADLRPRLRIGLALFDSEYKDMQVTVRDPVSGLSLVENAASSRIYGGELEVTAVPTDPLSVTAGLAYTHGRYLNFDAAAVTIPSTSGGLNPAGGAGSSNCVPGLGAPIGGNRSAFCNVSGNQLLRTPEVTADLNAQYTWDFAGGQWTLGGTVRYESNFFWDAFNRLREPGKATLDTEVSWSPAGKSLRIGLWGRNVTDRAYNESVTTSTLVDQGLRGMRRTVGVRFSQTLN
jgi:iron complex outermembrane recepter protein